MIRHKSHQIRSKTNDTLSENFNENVSQDILPRYHAFNTPNTEENNF